jgi:hypothetical protein
MKSADSYVYRLFTRFIIVIVGLAVATGPAVAQESRGLITGTVSDSHGAVVPGAVVIVTNADTGTSTTTVTTGDGLYTVPYLTPGRYTVAIEAAGFKKLVRHGVEVRVGDKVSLNLSLEPGGVQETITVTAANTPLIEGTSATLGQVIDRRRVSELPLADGNPFALARLAPGVNVFGTGFLGSGTQPFSTTDPSSITTNGAAGGNEFTLDGAPNTVDERPATGNRIGQQPPADAVQEFKVTTSSFDAQQGHTAGASIDVAIRSGTNNFHGTLYEFVRNDALGANNFFTNRSASLGLDDEGKAKRPARRYNRFGGTIGGPVYFPSFGAGDRWYYSGRERTFFFVSYEGIRTKTPTSDVITVPTAAQRQGDFSALLPLGIRIYDPLTARREGSRIVRSPFDNNIIPSNRISPVARAFLQFFPLPNQPGDAQGRNNYATVFSSDNVYDWLLARVDHTISDRQKFFVRYSRGERTETDENRTGITNGIKATGFREVRVTNNGIYDHVYTLTPTTILNVRAGFSRFYNPERSFSDGLFDPANLGFSARTVSQFSDRAGLPRLDIPNFINLGGRSADLVTHNIYYVQPNITKIAGNHSLRFGYDFRTYRENVYPPADVAGRYRFQSNFTRQTDQSSTAAPIGQELAAFLLGIPGTNTVIVRPSSRSNQNIYHGVYLQDDWKLTKRLTLNLGVRYEYEAPTTERYNRNVRLFDQTTASPIEAAARAAYATNPIPEIALNDFRVRGGLVLVDENNRGFYDADKNNLQPRLGFAYQFNSKMALRGGYALYASPFTIDGFNQTGFDFTTASVPTADNGLTFQASFADPWPSGVVDPPGASRGLATFIGQTLGGAVNLIAPTIDRRVLPLTIGPRKNPLVHRFELSLQRELPGQWLVDVAFIGSRGRDLTTFADLNAIPRRYQSPSSIRDASLLTFLEANFPNPFRGLPEAVGSGFFSQQTLQRQQLLRPFPQFQSVFVQRNDGRSSYNSAQVRLERRFAQGFTLLGGYVFSKNLEEITRLNPTDEKFEKRLAEADAPHRFTLSGIYELPFGRGKRWGSGASRKMEALIGGYQFNFIYTYQSGIPLTLGNVFFNGDPGTLRVKFDGRTVDNVFNTNLSASGFYFTDAAVRVNPNDANSPIDPNKQRNDPRINLAQNIRRLSSRLPNLRGDTYNIVDFSMIKSINFTESLKLQLRFELLNTFNHPFFGVPDLNPRSSSFGRVPDEQVNLPRELQIGIKLIF